MIEVRDAEEDTLMDAVRVCSRNKMDDPVQRQGIRIRLDWLRDMTRRYGSVAKIAYLDGEPVAQIMFYPEEALPYLPLPRRGVVRVECIYNSDPRARGRGVGRALLQALQGEAETGLPCLGGEECRFMVAEAFQTGEGTPMDEFYLSNGFMMGEEELYYPVHGEYEPRGRVEYTPLPEDRGVALVFYNRNCEYSYPFALRIQEAIGEAAPELPVRFVDMWAEPEEAARRGVGYAIVNGVPMKSFIGDREAFRGEVQSALKA